MSSDVGDVLFCHVVHAIPDTPPLRPYIHPISIPSPIPAWSIILKNTKAFTCELKNWPFQIQYAKNLMFKIQHRQNLKKK